jgi:hypothetical protein
MQYAAAQANRRNLGADGGANGASLPDGHPQHYRLAALAHALPPGQRQPVVLAGNLPLKEG